jgi:hypothetical protein
MVPDVEDLQACGSANRCYSFSTVALFSIISSIIIIIISSPKCSPPLLGGVFGGSHQFTTFVSASYMLFLLRL